MVIEPLVNENGITVTELKEWLASFPQDFDFDGEENSVWIERSAGRSSPVTEVCRLNDSDVILA